MLGRERRGASPISSAQRAQPIQPTEGSLSTERALVAIVPVAAGWAIVHGRNLVAYRALSWLSRTAAGPADLANEMARTAAEALRAPGATLWLGHAGRKHAVGV